MTSLSTHAPIWKKLCAHRDVIVKHGLSDIILNDPDRVERQDIKVDGINLNYTLNKVTTETMDLLIKLASECRVESWRARMFAGEKINHTEKRAALHTALRQLGDMAIMVDGHDIVGDIRTMQKQMQRIVADIRDATWKGHTGRPIRHIVNIGIGGSDLGPRLVCGALAPNATGPEVHFVANVDAADLLPKLTELDAAETVFIVASKTFTTQETLLNATTAREWLTKRLGDQAVAKHFIAVTTNHDGAKAFGILPDNILPIWDWVGGRFSVWSGVGLSIALSLGMDTFMRMLEGAAAMDQHFRDAPLAKNMPIVLAMLGIWNSTIMGADAHAVLPYCERLRELPRFLQQLEMESNGKTTNRDGVAAETTTCPVLFGEPGTVAQHSLHQWLHQGTLGVSADFIGVAADRDMRPDHHKALLANMTAQACALAFGSSDPAKPEAFYPGNKSSTMIMLERLDARNLGMLLALYEHKVFVQSVIWNINCFDQPGVELGKSIAKTLLSNAVAADPVAQFMARFHNRIAV
jgi:glucose-6-phosphate isomerase